MTVSVPAKINMLNHAAFLLRLRQEAQGLYHSRSIWRDLDACTELMVAQQVFTCSIISVRRSPLEFQVLFPG
jgi:hypothetical protein